jgi:hypothetical protein
MNIPPPPQAVIDRVLERHGNALRAAFAQAAEKQVRDAGVALLVPHGDVATLVIQGAVVYAEGSVVHISKRDARALAEALLEFAEG